MNETSTPSYRAGRLIDRRTDRGMPEPPPELVELEQAYLDG
jgi:hypothetical protein